MCVALIYIIHQLVLHVNTLEGHTQSDTHITKSIDGFKCSSDRLIKATSFIHTSYSRRSVPRATTMSNLFTMVLLLCGDIQTNPGPTQKSVFPCGYCEIPVNWSDLAVCCDECSVWYHKSCHEVSTKTYENMENRSWICGKCGSYNWCDNTYHSYELNDPTPNHSAINDSVFTLPSPSNFAPTSFSSPTPGGHTSQEVPHRVMSHTYSSNSTNTSSGDPLPPKSRNWRTLIANANGIAGKTVELGNIVEYTKPDAILITETKLTSSHRNAEFMPPGYSQPKRKDRAFSGGGGVLIAVRDCYNAIEIDPPGDVTPHDEIIWVEVSLRNKQKLVLGCFYRTPSGKPQQQLDGLETSLNAIQQKTKNNNKSTIILGGDFNFGEIDWETETVEAGKSKITPEKLIRILRDHHLTQLQREPTRGDRVLDLMCTNKPSLTKSITTIPWEADHNAIVSDCDVKPMHMKRKPRRIHIYSKAKWTNMRCDTKAFVDSYVTEIRHNTIDENWNKLKSHIVTMIDKHVPSKMTSKRQHLPWLSPESKRKMKRKHRMYKRAKKTGLPEHKESFERYKKQCQKENRKAHKEYVNNLVTNGLNTNNKKPFWKYIKAQRQDSFGIPPLKHDGILHTDSETKANILLKEFKSVFTKEDKSHIPQLSGNSHSNIPKLTIHQSGVEKLLSQLKPEKASGPDNIPNRVLKELSTELAPAVTAFFSYTLDEGTVPEDWTKAAVSPIYKKGNVHVASNYRPVSLTCTLCKVMEHIICKHILNHLEKNGILTALQHGFRKMHSCETQLLLTLDDLMSAYDQKCQVDTGILDFSRAFDTVPHQRLLGKLSHYGIVGPVHSWIKSFLCDRQMWVALDGVTSSTTSVDSGVPQGTVLGPLLFLVFINDLPCQVSPGTTIRLFADDCLVYRKIHNLQDQDVLQRDLNALEKWSQTWGMRFNPSKCTILRSHRSRSPMTRFYTLCGETLSESTEAKYLGVFISNDLNWEKHVNATAQRASNTLNFVIRNLKYCPAQAKEMAYNSLVRSTMEYSASVWDPHLQKHCSKLERVNRRAARFVKADFSRHSSVTMMMKELGWNSLADRRLHLRLTLMYKVVNGLVAVPSTNLIPADNRTRSNHPNKFRTIRASTEVYRNSYFPRTIPQWNNLPSQTVTSSTIDSFKNNLTK